MCKPVKANAQPTSSFKIKTIARSIDVVVGKLREGKRQLIAPLLKAGAAELEVCVKDSIRSEVVKE